MKRRPKIMTTCPFCNAPQEFDTLHRRNYLCGCVANWDTGIYTRPYEAAPNATGKN